MALALAAFSQSAFAVVYPLPAANSRLIGQNIEITVPQDNKLPLEAFAAQYQMGLSNMLEANPGMDVYLPQAGKKMIVPQQLILPDALSLIHISEPTRPVCSSRMPSSA